ncbi:MAG: hypothetical protein JXR23_04305 [Pontiellaceae bacterium]|nr:hypothetical protein [Pontiellaceae bacterium]
MKTLVIIALFVSILGCSPEKTAPDQIVTAPSISLLIDEAKVVDGARHLDGQIKLDGFQNIQSDGRLSVAYYLYHHDPYERTDLKCFLRSKLAHNLDRPHAFNITLGDSFELDLDEYSSLLVVVLIKTTDKDSDPIQLCDMEKIKWESQQ